MYVIKILQDGNPNIGRHLHINLRIHLVSSKHIICLKQTASN